MATTITTSQSGTAAPVAEVRKVGQDSSHYLILVIRYVVMILKTIIFLGPFVMALLGSLKTTSEVLTWPPTLLPSTWRLQNYSDVFNIFSRFYVQGMTYAGVKG